MSVPGKQAHTPDSVSPVPLSDVPTAPSVLAAVAGHTAGPWVIDGETRPADICTVYHLPRSEFPNGFAYVRGALGDWDADEAENMANARLIAAAPDLLRELQHLARLLEPALNNGQAQVPGLATLNGAWLAIAKATGANP